MRKSISMAIFALISIALTESAVSQTTGTQLKGDLRVHDPVMIKENGVYYVFATGSGVSILRSEDRINWSRAGRVFQQNLEWWQNDIPDHNGHIWAPDIHYRDGKYHLYYSVSAWMNFNSSIGYATNVTLDTEDPDYEWIDEGMIISYKNGGEGVNVIDPNIFVDDFGRVWLFYGSYKAGLRVVELDRDTGKLLNDPPAITIITPALGEGVFVIKSGEYYYIFASRGRCCSGLESTYQIVIGRSRNVHGPYLNKENESWMDNKYTLLLAGDYEEPGRGHNGIFTERDTTYIVYHAYTRSADGASLLNIKPLYVDDQGWPTLEPGKSSKLFKAIDRLQHSWKARD
jgi:arabinan endo-1,5-alpha-L-arabinosidase